VVGRKEALFSGGPISFIEGGGFKGHRDSLRKEGWKKAFFIRLRGEGWPERKTEGGGSEPPEEKKKARVGVRFERGGNRPVEKEYSRTQNDGSMF